MIAPAAVSPRIGCFSGHDKGPARLDQAFVIEKRIGASRDQASPQKEDCHEEDNSGGNHIVVPVIGC